MDISYVQNHDPNLSQVSSTVSNVRPDTDTTRSFSETLQQIQSGADSPVRPLTFDAAGQTPDVPGLTPAQITARQNVETQTLAQISAAVARMSILTAGTANMPAPALTYAGQMSTQVHNAGVASPIPEVRAFDTGQTRESSRPVESVEGAHGL